MKCFHILCIITLLISLKAYSQLDKKIWLVGGTGSFQSYTQYYTLPPPGDGWTNYNFDIEASAKVGYFVIDKLVLGLSPSYTFEKSENDTKTISGKSSKFSVGPFARYYFLNMYKPFNVLAEVNYQTGIQSQGSWRKDNGPISSFSFFVGPELFFNPTIGIEVLLGYKATKETIDGSRLSITDARNGFQVAVGLQIHLENFKNK